MKLNKKEIVDLLPHREPMLLIDELIDIKKLHSAKAIMNVKEDAFYVNYIPFHHELLYQNYKFKNASNLSCTSSISTPISPAPNITTTLVFDSFIAEKISFF